MDRKISWPKTLLFFQTERARPAALPPDENISNIYKLFRATRCGPETEIDPSAQLTFYDPGLGSQPDSDLFCGARLPLAAQSREPSDRPRNNAKHYRLLRRNSADVAARRSRILVWI